MKALKPCVLQNICPGDDGIAKNVLWRGKLTTLRKDSPEIEVMGTIDELVSRSVLYYLITGDVSYRQFADSVWRYAFTLTTTDKRQELPEYTAPENGDLYCLYSHLRHVLTRLGLDSWDGDCNIDPVDVAYETVLLSAGTDLHTPSKLVADIVVRGEKHKVDELSQHVIQLSRKYVDVKVDGWFIPSNLQSARVNMARANLRRIERYLVGIGNVYASAVVNRLANLAFAVAVYTQQKTQS